LFYTTQITAGYFKVFIFLYSRSKELCIWALNAKLLLRLCFKKMKNNS